MTWKRSKDGGLDYDPKVHEEHQQTFNPYGSAHTFTFDLNQEVLPLPKRSVKERFNDYKRRRGLA